MAKNKTLDMANRIASLMVGGIMLHHRNGLQARTN